MILNVAENCVQHNRGCWCAFEGLSERLQQVFGRLRGKGKVTEDDVNEAMREVRLALLEADVNFKVVKDFIAKVKEQAVGQEVMKSFTPGMVGHRHRQQAIDRIDGRHAKQARQGRINRRRSS